MVKIGFIGLGVMGNPMVKNLLKAGFSVMVWNRTRSRMDELLAMGAKGAKSPREVAQNSDIVVTMVSDSSDVEAVVLGASGVIEGAKPDLVVIDMSTISPQVTRRIAKTLSEKGVKMLDAPVSGGDVGAKQGTLSIMVGGPKEAYEKCLPVLQALGKRITHMGDNGNGQATKLCNQVIVGLNLQAVSEGLMLGAKFGLDLEKLIEVISAGAGSSWGLANLGPRMLKRDFEPGFRVRHQQKDLRIALSEAAELDLPLPGTARYKPRRMTQSHQQWHQPASVGTKLSGRA